MLLKMPLIFSGVLPPKKRMTKQPCLRLVDLLLRFEHPVDRLLDGWLAIVVGRPDCAEIIYGLAGVIFFTINFRPDVQARIVAVGDEEMHKFRSRRQAVASGGLCGRVSQCAFVAF